MKKIFIAAGIRAYSKNAVYIFVDFRIKRAGSSNYGGRCYSPGGREPVAQKVNMVAQRCHSERNVVERRISTPDGTTNLCVAITTTTFRSFASLRMTRSGSVKIEYGRVKHGI